MTDAMRAVELHAIAGAPHAESSLMFYLPQERLLIEADAFTPGAPNAVPGGVQPEPSQPDREHRGLGLPVDRIAPLHGRVVPVAELYAAAGKTPR
jgi:hypothetical protein